MELRDTRTGMTVLDREACLGLLRTVPVGRVAAVIGGGQPHIMPVNFTVVRDATDGDAIVFRTDTGTKLRSVERGRIAFEADHYDATSRTAWSVVVHGEAEEIDPPPAGASHDPDPWGRGEKSHWVRIRATTVTGRRIP
jgi:nitroimidazol reductase NimA-like FMN-containing flavoprotein (pyridoxamine 5'-phosphate oxidase superfamily)